MSATALTSAFSSAKISKIDSFVNIKSSVALRNLTNEYAQLISSTSFTPTAQKPSDSDLNPEWVAIDNIPKDNLQYILSAKSVKTVAKFNTMPNVQGGHIINSKFNKDKVSAFPTHDAFEVWKSLLFRDKIWNLIRFAKSKTLQSITNNEKATTSSQNLRVIRNFQNLHDKQNMAENYKKKKENFKNYLAQLNCESKKKHNLFPKARVTQIHAMFDSKFQEYKSPEEKAFHEKNAVDKNFQEKYILFSDSVAGLNKLVTEPQFYASYTKDSQNGSFTYYHKERGTLENDRDNIKVAIDKEMEKYNRVDTIMELQKEFKDLRQSKIAKGTGR